MSYIGQEPGLGQAERFIFTASGGETVVSHSTSGLAIGYTEGQVSVFLNGVKLVVGTDCVATNGSTITGLSALSANDVIEVVALSIFSATTVQWTSLLGDYAKIPSVTTTERDALTAAVGMLVYNTTLGIMQQYNASGWGSINSAPSISSLNYPGDDTALDIVGEFNLTSSTTANGDATITVSSTTALKQGMAVSGTGIPANATVLSITDSTHFELSANATATGSANVTLTFNTQTLIITGTNFSVGATVTIDGTVPSTVSRDSSTQITVTGTPAKTAGTKVDGLVVSNTTGLSASINVDYSALPAWTTASGNVLSALPSTISTIDLAATNATSYAITSGALPTGLAMNTSTGDITGTMSGTAQTYNFTVNATDAEAQSSPRLFNIILASLPTGGAITTYSGYRVHSYYIGMSEAFTFVVTGNQNVDYLVVAGGGGGGNCLDQYASGGGGAGGFFTASGFAVTPQTYTITVGTGGRGGESNSTPAQNGTNSVFDTITALGGGAGGWNDTGANSGQSGASGGSGGGAAGSDYNVTNGGAGGANSQGNAGGEGNQGSNTAGGGGGGHTSVGANAGNSANGGNGGAGTANSYRTGSAVTYAGGGGGGSGYHTSNGSSAGTGGAGGGGSGSPTGAGSPGTAHTGGGGGGGKNINNGAADGGSGIVIIRYAV